MKNERNIDNSAYHEQSAYLKRLHENYEATKSSVFSEEDCKNFIENAPNNSFLPMKVRKFFIHK